MASRTLEGFNPRVFIRKLIRSNWHEREQAMGVIADGLAKMYSSRWNMPSPPFEMRKLASLRQVNDIVEIEQETSGKLLIQDDGFTILLRKVDSDARRTFTLAHEIGHTLFYDLSAGKPLSLLADYYIERDLLERLCNSFAAQLLLPKAALLKSPVGTDGFTDHALRETMAKLHVGIETLIRRAEATGLRPRRDLAVALFRRDKKSLSDFRCASMISTWPIDSRRIRGLTSQQLGLVHFPKDNILNGNCVFAERVRLRREGSLGAFYEEKCIVTYLPFDSDSAVTILQRLG